MRTQRVLKGEAVGAFSFDDIILATVAYFGKATSFNALGRVYVK